MAINQTLSFARPNTRFKDVPNDTRRVIYAALTSADDLDGGAITGATGLTYNSNGAYNGGDSYIKWDSGDISATQKAALELSFHLHFEVESNFQADFTASPQRIIDLTTGPQKIYQGTSEAQLFSQLGTASTNVAFAIVAPSVASRVESHVSIDIVGRGANVMTYIDGILVARETTASARDFTDITLFASRSGTEIWGASAGSTARVKNLYLTSGVPSYAKSYDVGNMTIFGDSLSTQGNLEAGYPNQNGTGGDADFGDYSTVATIIKGIAKSGLDTNIINRAVSGNTLAQTQTIVDGLVNGDLANHCVIVNIGINDAQSGTLPVGWEAAYQTLITDITALGANHLFLCNLTSTAEDSTNPDATSQPGVDDANTALDALVIANSNCTKAGLFSVFGGHSFNSSYYKTANLHWNITGSRVAGETILDAIKNKFSLS